MNTINLLIICTTILLIVAIICTTIITWINVHVRNGQSVVSAQMNSQNFSAQLKSAYYHTNQSQEDFVGEDVSRGSSTNSIQSHVTKVFIAHSAACEPNREKWLELKKSLESISETTYDVFDDSDSGTESDVKYCIDNINASTIIIVLVGDSEPFKNRTGVFCDEMMHLGGNEWSEGKLIYICSYGVKDPLDIIVNSGDEKNVTYLMNLKKRVKNHNFNCDDMRILAKEIDNSYRSAKRKLAEEHTNKNKQKNNGSDN